MKQPDREIYISRSVLFWVVLFVFFVSPLNTSNPQSIEKIADPNLFLQPKPKKIIFSGLAINLRDKSISIQSSEGLARKAGNYLKKLLSEKFAKMKILSGDEGIEESESDLVTKIRIDLSDGRFKPQGYSIICDKSRREITISAGDQLGLLYGAVSASELFFESDAKLFIALYEIHDFPSYERRIIQAFFHTDDVEEILDIALKNKFESVAIASRQFPWFALTDEYTQILKKIKSWRDRFGGPEIMQMHNIYDERPIVISNESDVNELKNTIKYSYDCGARKLMILSDDTPPYEFGKGYVLTDENDKAKFPHFEAANTYLMSDLKQWARAENMQIEMYYVPAFYTYEEMHQGDMDLHKNTPWEEGAFEPFYRDLKFIGENMPEDVFLVWCGPYVRSRIITLDDLNDWKKNIAGRTPFLWDNTLYSHYPFTSTSMLTAWENELPRNFQNVTAGHGMFINSDPKSEAGITGSITANEYLWNPAEYNPDSSLSVALQRIYGVGLEKKVLAFRDAELEFRRTIGERDLWFQADSLWQQIRKVRYITQKNPFYYHLNYTRLKALYLQLKSSVPKPETKKVFYQKLKLLVEKKNGLLNELKNLNEKAYSRLAGLSSPMPDTAKIK